MNIDFGLICLFTLQLGLVMLTYHAWKGIKAEISALEVLREGNRAVTSRVDAFTTKMDSLSDRVLAIEAEPKKQKDRVGDVEDLLAKADRRTDALDAKVVSLGARVSAFAKHRKVKEEDEETDPAPQGEGEQIPYGTMPPGSIPLERQSAQASAVPPGFGVTRRSRHG